jgi:uncharacterized membrane protein
MTPSRTTPGPLLARIVMGSLTGASIGASDDQGLLVAGMVVGGIGGVVGAFAGYNARKRLVSGLKVKDAVVAVLEDLLAIGLAILIVCRVAIS